MTITEFLLQRIAEDEAVASEVVADMPRWDDPSWDTQHEADSTFPSERLSRRMSPDRVLAECEAKRRIVGRHDVVDVAGGCAFCGEPAPCEHLRILASVYSDHADYDPAWRP